MSLNILIVEDEENVGIALQTIMGNEYTGSNIVLARDGDEAWNKLQQNDFHLIIADWNMPQKTGDELLVDVRGNPKMRGIPFIMTTARSDKDSVVMAIQAGVNDYVRKPFEKKSLIEKTRKLLAPAIANLNTGAPAAPVSVLSPSEEIAERIKAGQTGFLVLPDLALAVQEIIRSGEKSVDVLVEVLKTSASVAAHLITLANSSHYRVDKECTTVKSAIQRIGFQEACDCVLALSIRDLFESDSVLYGDLLQRIWEHSLAVGHCASLLAGRLRIKCMENYCTMGLLHDIGKLMLINMLKELPRNGKVIDKASIFQVLDAYHQQVGADLLVKWKYPKPFIDLVRHHHDKDYLQQGLTGTRLVAIANILVRKIGLSLPAEAGDEFSDIELNGLLELDQQALDSVLMEVKMYIAAVKSVF
ncbi:MAG TPA: HDOD domain-containing protein [Burkholderiaceae bacterium]|jgi:putative nucleotidyltransferase with HDIG domain